MEELVEENEKLMDLLSGMKELEKELKESLEAARKEAQETRKMYEEVVKGAGFEEFEGKLMTLKQQLMTYENDKIEDTAAFNFKLQTAEKEVAEAVGEREKVRRELQEARVELQKMEGREVMLKEALEVWWGVVGCGEAWCVV